MCMDFFLPLWLYVFFFSIFPPLFGFFLFFPHPTPSLLHFSNGRSITQLCCSPNFAGNVANQIEQSFYSVYSYSGIESIERALSLREPQLTTHSEYKKDDFSPLSTFFYMNGESLTNNTVSPPPLRHSRV